MNMQKIAKIMLRRTSHDYILVRAYTWNRSRSGWYCMRSNHVRQAPPRQIERRTVCRQGTKAERLRYSGRGHRKTEYDAERLPGRVWIPAFQCCLVSLPEEHGDSGYGYREYPTPEKLQENQQRKIYSNEPERLLWIQAQDCRCTV